MRGQATEFLALLGILLLLATFSSWSNWLETGADKIRVSHEITQDNKLNISIDVYKYPGGSDPYCLSYAIYTVIDGNIEVVKEARRTCKLMGNPITEHRDLNLFDISVLSPGEHEVCSYIVASEDYVCRGCSTTITVCGKQITLAYPDAWRDRLIYQALMNSGCTCNTGTGWGAIQCPGTTTEAYWYGVKLAGESGMGDSARSMKYCTTFTVEAPPEQPGEGEEQPPAQPSIQLGVASLVVILILAYVLLRKKE